MLRYTIRISIAGQPSQQKAISLCHASYRCPVKSDIRAYWSLDVKSIEDRLRLPIPYTICQFVVLGPSKRTLTEQIVAYKFHVALQYGSI